MKTNKDKVVGQIYQTFDYDKFSIIEENRGHKETKGLKTRKIKDLQDLINSGKYSEEYGHVKVNEDFVIFDGRHTFEVRKRNKMPIRYVIIEDERFNQKQKKEMVNNVYSVNNINTAWSSNDLFMAAYQVKSPLAIILYDLMNENDNKFKWSDVMALLRKEHDMFKGRLKDIDVMTFSNKDLVETIKSDDFKLEINYFVKLNEKARVAAFKGTVLKSIYAVLWHAREYVNARDFRKACLSIPDEVLESKKSQNQETFTTVLVKHYNKTFGQSVNPQAVVYQCCKVTNHKEVKELVLE